MNSSLDDYEKLIRPIEQKMMRSIWRIVRDPDDAQDAFQDALAKIWKGWPKLLRHPNPEALVLKICADAAYDALRRRIRRTSHETGDASSELHPDPAPTASRQLANQELRSEIMNAIGLLPQNQAEAVMMRFVQELPYDEIASAMGCTEATVRAHIFRARARLSQLLAHLAPASSLEVIQ